MTPRVPISEAELRARAADLAAIPEPEELRDPSSELIVRIAGERRAITARLVREIVPRPVVTPLPIAPRFVAGAMNLRGDILAVLDPAIMEGRDGVAPVAAFAIVVEADDAQAALLVEAVDEMSAAGAAAAIDVREVLRHPQLLAGDDPVTR